MIFQTVYFYCKFKSIEIVVITLLGELLQQLNQLLLAGDKLPLQLLKVALPEVLLADLRRGLNGFFSQIVDLVIRVVHFLRLGVVHKEVLRRRVRVNAEVVQLLALLLDLLLV